MEVSLEGVILQGFYYAKNEEGGIPMAGRKPKPDQDADKKYSVIATQADFDRF